MEKWKATVDHFYGLTKSLVKFPTSLTDDDKDTFWKVSEVTSRYGYVVKMTQRWGYTWNLFVVKVSTRKNYILLVQKSMSHYFLKHLKYLLRSAGSINQRGNSVWPVEDYNGWDPPFPLVRFFKYHLNSKHRETLHYFLNSLSFPIFGRVCIHYIHLF